jgi:hypothetical protein
VPPLRTCALLAACLALACGGTDAARPGRLFVAVDVGGPLYDVASVALTVVPAGGDCGSAAPLGQATLSVVDGVSAIAAADGAAGTLVGVAFTLRPGAYQVCASPLNANGTPSGLCTDTQQAATVVSGASALVTLASLSPDVCARAAADGGAPDGGGDAAEDVSRTAP